MAIGQCANLVEHRSETNHSYSSNRPIRAPEIALNRTKSHQILLKKIKKILPRNRKIAPQAPNFVAPPIPSRRTLFLFAKRVTREGSNYEDGAGRTASGAATKNTACPPVDFGVPTKIPFAVAGVDSERRYLAPDLFKN